MKDTSTDTLAGKPSIIDTSAWPRPPIFDLLQRVGGIDAAEMLRGFNCGIGMLLVVKEEEATEILHRLRAQGERAYRIGVIEAKSTDEAPLSFGPLPEDS